ncbi:hypothetical protein SDC9_209428 [bioreactor metagenome]|uniref:Uncharacterized protein n=1 Tax=bioreactor metagenome TaxID=1076179 RepID=A0A645JE02_9ZZZZ
MGKQVKLMADMDKLPLGIGLNPEAVLFGELAFRFNEIQLFLNNIDGIHQLFAAPPQNNGLLNQSVHILINVVSI